MLRGLDSGLAEKMTVRLGGNLLRSGPHLRNVAKFLVESWNTAPLVPMSF
jgi:hypothetical protein